ncbi:MAG: class I SAM-dependent methyltransferase [Pirellulales bacterium]|nr:class I SAM-dependent methyltransferase [Pirellulales bacterium]
MDITSIPDLSLADSLRLVARHFDVPAIVESSIDQASVLDYYQQSDRGYRLFHSQDGAMHVALNRDKTFTRDGYLGQVDLIAQRLENLEARQVLEVGCGVGYNARHLAERMPRCHFTGMDLSESHIRSAGKEVNGLMNLGFETGDFQKLQYDNESFDVVFAVECLCQADDMRQAMKEIFRVLRPGGRLLVIDCFRSAPLDNYQEDQRLAVQLVEKTMAVHEFAVLSEWLEQAHSMGFKALEQTNLSSSISHNLARLYHLSRRFFRMPRAARAFLKAFPPRLLQNSISGLLMPFTVGSGAHQYFLLELQRQSKPECENN